jgi:hypothetical protein
VGSHRRARPSRVPRVLALLFAGSAPTP